MSPAQAADRAYSTLKQRLLVGLYPMGFRLEAAPIADDIHVSVTPVREALYRLAGQRLVHAVAGDGFYVPILSEVAIRDLFNWNAHLCLHALRGQHWPTSEVARVDQSDIVARGACLFLRIAAAAENGELSEAVNANNDRLAPLRAVDTAIFSDAAEEMSNMEQALTTHDRELLSLVRAYHRRRKHAVMKYLRHLVR